MVRQLGRGERRVCRGPGHGFEDGVRDAEDFRGEGLGVRAPCDAQGGGGGVRGLGVGVWARGVSGYGGGGAVGEEERVGFDVRD